MVVECSRRLVQRMRNSADQIWVVSVAVRSGNCWPTVYSSMDHVNWKSSGIFDQQFGKGVLYLASCLCNPVACKGYTSVLSKMVSVIFAVSEVSFWALTTVVKLPWKFLTLIIIVHNTILNGGRQTDVGKWRLSGP